MSRMFDVDGERFTTNELLAELDFEWPVDNERTQADVLLELHPGDEFEVDLGAGGFVSVRRVA